MLLINNQDYFITLFFLILILIVLLYFFYKTFIFLPIKIKSLKNLNKHEICHLYGFISSYGVGVDKEGKIYIPDFNTGFIYKVNLKKNKSTILKIYKKKLTEISFFEKFFFFSFLKNIFKIRSNILKPHDIYFDEKNCMYISQMGFGNKKGHGKVTVISTNKNIKYEIGLSENNHVGLIDPVMTFVNKNITYVSENGANKILRYNKKKFKDWIGNKEYKNSFISKNNLFININLNKPHAVKVSRSGDIFIADTKNHRICKFSKNGVFVGWIGKRSDGTINNNWSIKGKSIAGFELGAFNRPIDIILKNFEIYISDCFNNRIVKVSLNGKSICWFGQTSNNKNNNYIWNNTGKSISSNSLKGLNNPYSIKLVKDRLYIADKQNFRIKIIKNINQNFKRDIKEN